MPPRPPLSDEPKTQRTLRIRLTDKERKLLDDAAKKTSKPTSTWARDELLKLASE